MKKDKLFNISNISLKYKIISCMTAFFILISSINLLNFGMQKISFVESAKVSTNAIVVQFFYISTFSTKIIAKLFMETDSTEKISNPVSKAEEGKSKESSKAGNSSKASIGYLILSGTPVINKVIKDKGINFFSLAAKRNKGTIFEYFKSITFVSERNCVNVLFIMMLLLAILLARKNVGNTNIIIKIKNNRFARLMY